ncbi:MAG TPA: DEAD/DEAH box helicase family protein [Mycobacteriales bacterium]|nr:DEAD/DEAH box helicase family protein [Mycobacteriales bacterium]
MLQLREFQQQASDLIAERFRRYIADPPLRGTRSSQRRVPFFQALSSITASGKTVILADAVQAMAAELATAPIVLWLSKGKVVVQQTCANLAPGGKYHHLIGQATVDWLAAYDVDAIRDAVHPLIYVATVGTFNQRDRETSDLLVYRSELDTQDTSTWEALKHRTDGENTRRPLLIVYDEGHNLTDQQTDLLLELEPDAIVAASATMRLPRRLADEIKHLRDAGWDDAELAQGFHADGAVFN